MDKKHFTGIIKSKGWRVKDALEYWGRSYDWYHNNSNGGNSELSRLECMCNGLPDKQSIMSPDNTK